ncbi:MAG TPA: putative colanic acid biosynthesis acetyltransferase [Hyphomicrobiaceae bacterium]|nr:putative colanic acid biosynthesis acetyltransferase [Hyphomicrobiaceae bacterium]
MVDGHLSGEPAHGSGSTPLAQRPAPSVANKMARAAWAIVRALLFRPTPAPLHAWRCLLLRGFGARVGSRVAIYPSASIWAPWNLTIDAGATIGGGAIIYNVDRITVGEFAVISQGAHLCTASHAHDSPAFDLVTAPIRIEEEAWVAAEAFVGPGVTVSRAAVVGARAVVVRDVDERAIVAGNPARVIGSRAVEGRNRLKGRAPSEPEG